MQEQKQQKRGDGSHGNGQKNASKKLKKVVDKLEGMRYNKEVRESEQALKKALNIENFIV